MPRQIFKGMVIAAAGPLPGQLTTENLKRWTKVRRGRFSDDFDDEVTHLICTVDQFKKQVPRIREARRRGKRFPILHHDWFEFSATGTEKKRPMVEFSMRRLLASENAVRREQEREERGRREGERFVNSNLFHIYRDRDGFKYEVELIRDDRDTRQPAEKCILYLWESNAKPHLYWFVAKFLRRKGDSKPAFERPSPCSGKWRAEMNLFMHFFKKFTKIDWEDRVTYMKTSPRTKDFQYLPPSGGKPVGRRLRHSLDECLKRNICERQAAIERERLALKKEAMLAMEQNRPIPPLPPDSLLRDEEILKARAVAHESVNEEGPKDAGAKSTGAYDGDAEGGGQNDEEMEVDGEGADGLSDTLSLPQWPYEPGYSDFLDSAPWESDEIGFSPAASMSKDNTAENVEVQSEGDPYTQSRQRFANAEWMPRCAVEDAVDGRPLEMGRGSDLPEGAAVY